jgi:hypothetical protein
MRIIASDHLLVGRNYSTRTRQKERVASRHQAPPGDLAAQRTQPRHAGRTAAPPNPAMNSRRRIGHPLKLLHGSLSRSGWHGNWPDTGRCRTGPPRFGSDRRRTGHALGALHWALMTHCGCGVKNTVRCNKVSSTAERNLFGSGAAQSALMPTNLTTLPHFSVSAAMNLPKSAGEPRSAVPPRSASLVAGSESTALISLLRRTTISAACSSVLAQSGSSAIRATSLIDLVKGRQGC